MIGTKVNTKTHCRYCGEELSYDEKRDCKVCLICHPGKPDAPAKPTPEKPKFLDERMTEARVREIVRDEMENWHIPKPSVTKEEVENLTNNVVVEPKVKEKTWRDKAKEMGVPTHYKVDGKHAGGMRKKVDVLADIKAKETKESTEVDETTRP